MTEAEKEHIAADGTVRQDHYGQGRQPIDDIIDLGWGPEFCAGNALKYVRRDHTIKGVERDRDLKHALWYYQRLAKLCSHETDYGRQLRAHVVMREFLALVTPVEFDLLNPPA